MIDILCLDENYSTTRLLTQKKPHSINNLEDKFETILFLSTNEQRQGEGGLRIKGYFKKSYEDKPLISIVTVVFNGEKYLEETIQSVLNQTYDNVEYIIIDGGSTDGTLDIIKKYDDKIDYWVSEKDKGIYDAWNKGVKISSGSWIGFLGSDDFYTNNAIKIYTNVIKRLNKEIDYISSRVLLCDFVKKPIRKIGEGWCWSKFSVFMNVAHVGSLHKRELYKTYGLYNLEYKICGDYEFLLRPRDHLKAAFIDEILCFMREGGISNANYKVFQETFKAKVTHKTRPLKILVHFDDWIAKIKWIVRKYAKK